MEKHKMNEKDAEEELKKGAKRITEDDLNKVIEKQAEIEKKFKANGPLGRYIEDVKLLFSMLKDYMNGKYRGIPFYSIAAVAAALLYVLSPIDLIPDFIPVVGYIDDALVVSVCLMWVEQDLHNYKEWKMQYA